MKETRNGRCVTQKKNNNKMQQKDIKKVTRTLNKDVTLFLCTIFQRLSCFKYVDTFV